MKAIIKSVGLCNPFWQSYPLIDIN